jgi:hypothetical protein
MIQELQSYSAVSAATTVYAYAEGHCGMPHAHVISVRSFEVVLFELTDAQCLDLDA